MDGRRRGYLRAVLLLSHRITVTRRISHRRIVHVHRIGIRANVRCHTHTIQTRIKMTTIIIKNDLKVRMYTTDDLDISVATITGDESTIILDFSVNPPVPVNPPPAPPPAPAPAPSPAPPTDGLAGKPVVVTGTLSDGTTINVSLYPGQRSPLITSTLIGSVVYHADGLSVCIENATWARQRTCPAHLRSQQVTRKCSVVR